MPLLDYPPLFTKKLCVILLLSCKTVVNTLKILIAVNSEVLTEPLRASLPQYDVHISHSGLDALTQINKLRPDVLLLELALPDMNGFALLQKAQYRPPKILALTNLANHTVLTAAASLGIQEVLLLPCTIRHIAEHLYCLIEKTSSAEV